MGSGHHFPFRLESFLFTTLQLISTALSSSLRAGPVNSRTFLDSRPTWQIDFSNREAPDSDVISLNDDNCAFQKGLLNQRPGFQEKIRQDGSVQPLQAEYHNGGCAFSRESHQLTEIQVVG